MGKINKLIKECDNNTNTGHINVTFKQLNEKVDVNMDIEATGGMITAMIVDLLKALEKEGFDHQTILAFILQEMDNYQA